MNITEADLSLKNKPLFNIGTGKNLSVKELAELIKEITGFKGKKLFDTSKPDGTPQKLFDVSSIINFDWFSKININTGINLIYEWYSQL